MSVTFGYRFCLTCAISTKCPITELCLGINEVEEEDDAPALSQPLLPLLLQLGPSSVSTSAFCAARLALLVTLEGEALGAVEYSEIFTISDFSRSHSQSKYFCVALKRDERDGWCKYKYTVILNVSHTTCVCCRSLER